MTTPNTHDASRSARLACLVMVFALLVPFASRARADALDDAEGALEDGRPDAASSSLLDWLLEEDEDPARLLRATRLASRLGDLDLVERAQGRTEIARRDVDDPRLELALAIAYHTLASERLSRGIQSPTLAMLFADAEAQARAVLDDPALADEGRRILARVRWEQGDVDGALDALAPFVSGATDDGTLGRHGPASAHLLRGRLHYDRAVTRGLAPDGRPTDEGLRDLRAALEALGYAVTHLDPDVSAKDRFDLWMTLAWSAHRLGEIGAAQHAYTRAWSLDPTSPLPLRGLQSLLARRPGAYARAVAGLIPDRPAQKAALEALADAHLAAGRGDDAVAAAMARIMLDEGDPAGWTRAARIHLALEEPDEAYAPLVRALELDPGSDVASQLLDRTARSFVDDDPARAFAIYDELLSLRPRDPYVRNNYGFLLREAVSPHTTMQEDGIQTLKPDAPAEAREHLDRCLEVYAEASALIDPDAEVDEKTAWVLAGIVNDYGLMLHYFADVQDAEEAERQYLRALAMTDYAFKDTYLPNLRRLYTTVLPNRLLALYRVAREARDAILLERPTADGSFELVPDEQKRQIAGRDVEALRTALYERLAEDAEDDESDWPPR